MNNTEENYIFLVYNVLCSFRENLAKLCAPWTVHAPHLEQIMHLCISYIIFKYLCANVFLFYII